MQVKRGEAAIGELKQTYPEAWQRTKNDELAQILYSGIYQKPGIARSSKNSLFTNFSKYNEIFGPEYSTDLIRDLLVIKTAYKNWAKEAVARNANSNNKDILFISYPYIRVGRNCKFIISLSI